MGRVRAIPTTRVPRKQLKSNLDRSISHENSRCSLVKCLQQQQTAEVYDPSDPLLTDSATSTTSTDVNTSIQFHKNRKTSHMQTGLLKELLPEYHYHSANGLLRVFRARTNGRWHRQFPESFGSYLLDCDDKICLIPSYLIGVHDSPPGASYPRMSEGCLDFGPTMKPCYDNCPLVNKTQLPDYDRVLAVLLCFVVMRRNQLKNWFNNNRITHAIPKVGKIGRLQVNVVLPRIPQAVHLYSGKYYPTRVYPHVAAEAARRGIPTNNISLVRDMTKYIWDNETPEIKKDINDCVEKERELITAFREGKLGASDLSSDKKASVIDSLDHEFEGMTKNLVNYLQFNYGCTTSDGKNFINSFNDTAEIGHIPGTPEGESRAFSQYYGLPFMYHMKKVQGRNGPAPAVEPEAHIESPADVDPATLVHDDAAGNGVAVSRASNEQDSFQLPEEATTPVAQSQMAPPAQMSSEPLPWSRIPSPVVHSSPVTTSSASISSSPITTEAAPPRETALISPQSGGQGVEMDTNPDLHNVLWGYSHSDDSMKPLDSIMLSSPALSGINDDHFGANVANSSFDMDVDLLRSQWPDFSGTVKSNSSWNAEVSGSDGDLSQFMESLGLSDIFASPDRSAQTVTESHYAATVSSATSSDSQAPSDQLAADVIMHESEPATNYHMTATPTSDLRSTLSAPSVLPDIANLPRQARQRKAPPPREVITLCGAEKDSGPPQWHQESLMAMQDQSLGPMWLSLVEKWYKLESDMWKVKAKTEGKYSLGKRRPQELTQWLDGTRYFNVELFIVDASRYGRQLVNWWNHLNPAWRRSNDNSGLPKPDYSKPLKCLWKGGRQGIVTVIFGLFWWGHACRGTEQLWFRMVSDVSKTIDVLM
ncbi:uncharacterized protein EV420DRAFT_1635926 [Desarmillaria tabescens]|uniref:Uncharacterized protein n=1 Tax=Armillaria tabescens TaxID=1929756 RepID=A0AA39NJP0_ARMTA|nr:uncharacterized protein EV420DRAFT_1635926 [Desarmillaria tabescens]KAK0466893.1 hypothetical protein EV420DRAFT_1635926 [Desarmillaria tabescens]